MSNKRLQNNPLAHLVSSSPQKASKASAKEEAKQKIEATSVISVEQDVRKEQGDFKRHTFFIRRNHIRTLKRLAYEQDRSIKDILDDVLMLGLKHVEGKAHEQ